MTLVGPVEGMQNRPEPSAPVLPRFAREFFGDGFAAYPFSRLRAGTPVAQSDPRNDSLGAEARRNGRTSHPRASTKYVVSIGSMTRWETLTAPTEPWRPTTSTVRKREPSCGTPQSRLTHRRFTSPEASHIFAGSAFPYSISRIVPGSSAIQPSNAG